PPVPPARRGSGDRCPGTEPDATLGQRPVPAPARGPGQGARSGPAAPGGRSDDQGLPGPSWGGDRSPGERRVRLGALRPLSARMPSMSEPPLRVLLVDDHEVVRDGVKVLLEHNVAIIDHAQDTS